MHRYTQTPSPQPSSPVDCEYAQTSSSVSPPTAMAHPPALSSSTSISLSLSSESSSTDKSTSDSESVEDTCALKRLTGDKPPVHTAYTEDSDDSIDSNPLALHDLSTTPPKKTGHKQPHIVTKKPAYYTRHNLSKRASAGMHRVVATNHMTVSETLTLLL